MMKEKQLKYNHISVVLASGQIMEFSASGYELEGNTLSLETKDGGICQMNWDNIAGIYLYEKDEYNQHYTHIHYPHDRQI